MPPSLTISIRHIAKSQSAILKKFCEQHVIRDTQQSWA
jgi:hypothetical protein